MFYVNNGNMFRVHVDLNTEYCTLNRYGFNLKNEIKISICQYGYVVSIS